MSKLVVAYVCDKDYLPFLKVSMESVKRYNKNVEFAVISKDHFEIQGAQVYTIIPNNKYFKFRLNDRMHDAVYYKFWLPILPYDKILYIDCDVMCQRPLDELWETPCNFICGTESHSIGVRQAKELGLGKYMLTGMMLMNLNELRKEKFTEKCLQRLQDSFVINQHDETVINLEFHDKLTFIDKKYNYCHNRKYENPIPESDAYLLHFVGKKEEKRDMLKRENFNGLGVLKELVKGKSIAIVGNSEKIFSKRGGKQIDNHDIVIRFNKGFPTKKISQGERTDILFLACTLTPEEVKIFNPKYTVKRSIYCGTKCDLELTLKDRSQFAQTPNKESTRQHISASQASTGFLAIQFALSTECKSIDLYGFDFFKNPTFYNVAGYQTLHNGSKEEEKILEYERCGLLKIN